MTLERIGKNCITYFSIRGRQGEISTIRTIRLNRILEDKRLTFERLARGSQGH